MMVSRRSLAGLIASALIAGPVIAGPVIAAPLMAQVASDEDRDEESGEESGENVRLAIDLLTPPPTPEEDVIAMRECEDQADAARIAGEIVVCRNKTDVTDGAWNAAEFERQYAERTQGPKAPNVDGSGLILPTEGSIIAVTVTMKLGDPPEGPLIVDIEALPEAPPDSDADRIARGLPLRQ